MGCDIHPVLERKHNGKWVGVDAFNGHHCWTVDPKRDWGAPVARSRNYSRFAALAGVRGDGPEPLGLPCDASDLTKVLYEDWGADAHSASWLPLDRATEIFVSTAGELTEHQKKYPASYFFGVDRSETISEHRLVFWFDN